jgi:hypothetical protein
MGLVWNEDGDRAEQIRGVAARRLDDDVRFALTAPRRVPGQAPSGSVSPCRNTPSVTLLRQRSAGRR